jgi:hypothetical protein
MANYALVNQFRAQFLMIYVILKMNVYVAINCMYETHLESKERFAIKKYLLIMRKKKNM